MTKTSVTILDYKHKRFLIELAKRYAVPPADLEAVAAHYGLPVKGEPLKADLCAGLMPRHIIEAERQWQNARHQLKLRCELARLPASDWPEHGHWNWALKIPERDLLAFKTYGIWVRDQCQGLILADAFHPARLQPDVEKPLVYVKFLEVAPWNLRKALENLGDYAQFGGVGSVLLKAAITWSVNEGFSGRLALHSLSQSRDFYANSGMESLGPDPACNNMEYFEMTASKAREFIN